MPTYHCANCDIDFDDETDAPRCPECLRQNGIELVTSAAPRPRPGRRRLVIVLASCLLLAAAIGLGLLLWRRAFPLPLRGQPGMLDPATLDRTLEHRGVSRAARVNPFAADEGIRKLAAAATGATARQKAESLAKVVAGRLREAHVAVDLAGTGDGPVRTATELQRLLDRTEPGTGPSLLSLELATHLVATLRAAGLKGVLCQVSRLKGPKVATAEVVGGIGRYVAAAYEKLDQKPVVVLDPVRALKLPEWAGDGDDPSMRSVHKDLVPLGDASAAAHLLALRAFRLRTSQPDQAYALSEMALKAASPSATLHLIRAKVLAAAGGSQDAEGEAQKALALKDGPPQRTLLALALAAQGAGGTAISHLEQALQQDPSYWPAHETLATLLLPVDPRRGTEYLRAGLAVAPDQPRLLLLEGSRLLAEGKAAEAAAVLERVVERERSDHALVLLYQAYRRAGEEQKALATRKRLLEATKKPDQMKQLLESLVDQHPAPDPPAEPPLLSPGPPKLELPDVSLKSIKK